MVTTATTTTVTTTINNTDAWATSTGAHMMLWISRPRSPRRRYPPEVYKPLGTIPGNGTTPPSNDQTFTNPWGAVTDQAVQWLRPSVIDINGRLSSSTNATDPQPKSMGTVNHPLDPCSGTTPITITPSAWTWTKDHNNSTIPSQQPNATPMTGTHLTGWAASQVQGPFLLFFQWLPTCPHSPTNLPARFFATLAGGAFTSEWDCPASAGGTGIYTATDPNTRPTTITLTAS
jgi:hypothetical protein